MRTIQSRQDLEDILNGTCILGSGGGGPWSVGNALIEPILKAGGVKLAEPSEAGDADHMAVAAGVGSPEAATSDPGAFAKIPVIAFDALAKLKGVTFDYVLPGEVGAGNSFVPMAVAATRGIPMIDGSGAGRAIPSLTMCTYASNNVPISPIVLANTEHQVSFSTDNAKDAEGPMRAIISDPQFGQDAGIAFWGMTGASMKKVIVPGTLVHAWDCGKALRKAKQSRTDPIDAVAKFLNGWVLFRGKFVSMTEQTRGGFDFGTTVLSSMDGSRQATVYNQNENLIAWSTQYAEPLAMGPDLICFLAADGTTFSNADADRIKPGQEIALIGMRCGTPLRDPKIVSAFMEAINAMGYAGPFVPIETLVERHR